MDPPEYQEVMPPPRSNKQSHNSSLGSSFSESNLIPNADLSSTPKRAPPNILLDQMHFHSFWHAKYGILLQILLFLLFYCS